MPKGMVSTEHFPYRKIMAGSEKRATAKSGEKQKTEIVVCQSDLSINKRIDLWFRTSSPGQRLDG
jgi:hypothetical protein